MKLSKLAIIIAIITAIACNKDNQYSLLRNRAKEFAELFFSCRYEQAMNYCTPESKVWIRFTASNITQEDLDVVNKLKLPTKCETTNLVMHNDSMATVIVKVCNFVMIDSIGITGKETKDEYFIINMKNHNNHWMVDLKYPPQLAKSIK